MLGAVVPARRLAVRGVASLAQATAWCQPGLPGPNALLLALQRPIQDLQRQGDDIYWLMHHQVSLRNGAIYVSFSVKNTNVTSNINYTTCKDSRSC